MLYQYFTFNYLFVFIFLILFMYGQTFYINKRQTNSVTTAHLSEQNAHDKARVQFVGTNILIH